MSNLRVISDVHGKYDKYLDVVADCDYSVQLGDFGFEYGCLNQLSQDRHKICLGNHENYDHRPTGYDLGDYGIATLGSHEFFYVRGGFSLDLQSRIQHEQITGVKSWWSNEQLSVKECEDCLELYNREKPDVVMSHSCPAEISNIIGMPGFLRSFGWSEDMTTQTQHLLQFMFEDWQPKIHIFGHMHRNWEQTINGTKFICINELEYIDFNENWEIV